MIKVTLNTYRTSAPDSISSAMEINVGHEYCMALKYPRSHSIAVSTVIVILVQGQFDRAVRETPSPRLYVNDIPTFRYAQVTGGPYCHTAGT